MRSWYFHCGLASLSRFDKDQSQPLALSKPPVLGTAVVDREACYIFCVLWFSCWNPTRTSEVSAQVPKAPSCAPIPDSTRMAVRGLYGEVMTQGEFAAWFDTHTGGAAQLQSEDVIWLELTFWFRTRKLDSWRNKRKLTFRSAGGFSPPRSPPPPHPPRFFLDLESWALSLGNKQRELAESSRPKTYEDSCLFHFLSHIWWPRKLIRSHVSIWFEGSNGPPQCRVCGFVYFS